MSYSDDELKIDADNEEELDLGEEGAIDDSVIDEPLLEDDALLDDEALDDDEEMDDLDEFADIDGSEY